MPLVTEDDVRKLLMENATDMPNDQVALHITTADLIVTEDLTSTVLTTARKTQIELYLAAHFAVLTWEHGGLGEQKIGDSSEGYKSISSGSFGFSSTRFGQQALTLDVSGKLKKLEDAAVAKPPGSSKAALFRVV